MTDTQLTSVGLVRGESGFCDQFDTETNRCRTYDRRPEICRVKDTPGHYKETAAICNQWMRDVGIEKEVVL